MKKNLSAVVFSLIVIFTLYAAVQFLVPLPLGNKPIEFEIRQGATFRQIVNSLEERGLLRDKWTFHLLGRINRIDRRIRAGFYTLWGNMTPYQIFNIIREGRVVEFEITVIPGDSLREIEEKFVALGMTDPEQFMEICADREFLDSLDIDAPSLEGYLYPDTYRFPKGLSLREALTLMVERLWAKYTDAMLGRTYQLGLSVREVLTMASIVEKEAIVEDERTIIAAVYYNRLRKRMQLQADPTAIYGWKSSKERITRSDLLKKTSYNTYFIKGLPPGPIASPGIKSIEASLFPADVPYLYFVSNNDGTHRFSRSIQEHTDAVKAYREKRRAPSSQGSS